MTPAALSLVVLGASVGLFVWNRLPVSIVAIATSLALLATGVIDLDTAVGGFGDPVVVFIATLFVVSAGLEASGLTAWAGRVLTQRAGTGRIGLLVAVMALSAVLSAVITPNGAVAAMLPVVVAAARRAGIRPSALLMPVAFAASAGALLTLSGSVVNVLVSEAAQDVTGHSLGFFEFAIAGVPLLVGSVLVAVVAGRLIPQRESGSIGADFGDHLDTLVEHYHLETGFFRLRVSSQSAVVGAAAGLDGDGVRVFGVQDAHGTPVSLERECEPGDVLVATGSAAAITRLAERHHLELDATPLTHRTRTALLNEHVGLAEVVVAPRSALLDEVFFPGLVRGAVTVLGVRRLGKDTGAERVRLKEGDGLLLHGTWESIAALETDDDVLVVDSPDQVRQQVAPLGAPAWRAGIVLVAMVVLLASQAVPPAVAGLLAAVAMVLTRVVNVPQAFRAISWDTVVLIGGLIPLSVAIRESGAAEMIADRIVDVAGGLAPVVTLLIVFAVTAVLGQVVSNTATALVMLPIVLAVAADVGLDPRVALMTLAVAAGASLLTPIATPANMMIMTPGGYRFADYRAFGGATMIVWLVVAVLLVPVVWSTG